MFREMRRKRQQLPENEAAEILQNGTSGVLALIGDDGYPYTVPISYAYSDGKIYFHSAKSGHKIDSVLRNEKASFCVIDKDEIVPEKYTTYFRSAVAFGKIRIIDSAEEKRAALKILAERYCRDDETGIAQEIGKSFDSLCMLEMTVEHLTGKEAIELTKKRDM